MDKLAQKFSAQEMIKANSQAEAEELQRLQLQVSEYEKILQEMRKLNYKNTELAEKLELMIGENAGKIQSMKEDEQQLIAALRDLTDEQTRNREENVKVYRNVQAVVVDEIKRCIESLQEDRDELKKMLDAKLKKIMILSGISVAAALTSVVLWALMMTGVIK